MNIQPSLHNLQEIAQVACFSVDYQKKVEAQNYFVQITKSLSSQLILQILQNGSDTLIFVSIEYANKFIEQFSQQFLKEIFNAVEGQISTWYEPNTHQFRKKTALNINKNIRPQQITKYVMNSISLFLSNCMKRFYIQETFQKRSHIVNWIGAKQNQRYRLWLYKIFIQNISQIDSSMGFIKFRTLSYNFQQEVVPIIAKNLVPFLYRVEQIMKVNQLSILQENLNVDQTNIIQNGQKNNQNVFVNQCEFKFAELIFQLLHSLVFYNYHLTYTEYEQQSTFDNCLICFPQQFTSKVVTQEFMNSIGYVMQRLIDLMPQSQFLKTTLQCLQKIFLTKLSYVDEQKKISFIRECTLTLAKVLNKNNLNQYILTKLMVCNNKFVTNVEINYLKQKQQLKPAFREWLTSITRTTFLVLQNIQLADQFNFNLQDSLIIQCLQLYQKIVSSLCSISYYSFQETTQTDVEQKQYIQKNVSKITQILIKKLLLDQSRPLIQGTTAQIFKSNIIEIKTFCNCFFQPFKQLAGLNYGFFFSQIEKNIAITLQSPTTSIKFNLIMLLTQVIDRNFLQRNLIMTKASDQQVYILSKCVSMMLKFLQNYIQRKSQVAMNQQIMLLDMSILIFFDKLLSEFLSCFENHENIIQIKHRIFQNMLKIQNKVSVTSVSQEFLHFCIESVLGYLLIYNKTQQSKHINDFIFQTINRILMKFKWGIKRQIFKSSPIYFKLSQFFSQVSKQTNIQAIQVQGIPLNINLFNQFQRVKWRKQLLKIIALLYFDDVIDDYRKNLQNIFSNLKNENMLTILLDIEGIGEAIDTCTIYKVFLQMIQRYFSVQRLTNQLVHFASSFKDYDKISKKYPKIAIIKQVVRMHKSILSNKGQRMGNPQNLQSVYMIIKDLIGYWIDFIKMSQNQEWIQVLKQIIIVISQLIKCDKINFYIVQRICPQQYVIFFGQLFLKMLNTIQTIEQHPKVYEQFLQNIVNVSRQLLDVIFFPSQKIKNNQLKEKNKLISQYFIQLVFVIFKKVPTFLQEMKLGSTKNQNYLEKSLEIIKFTFSFINFKVRQSISHKQEMNDLKLYVEQMKQLVFQNEKLILDYLTSQKHFSIHKRILIIILYEGTIMYPQLMQVLIGGMNLPNYLFTQINLCIESIKKEEQQLFIDKFKTWLRMIHMTEQEVKKNKEEHSDFYGFMNII